MMERHLDGNAIGGLLTDLFGQEMTDRRASCGRCGEVGPIGEYLLFTGGPGDVLRCRPCGGVLAVVVSTISGTRIHFEALRWLEMGGRPPA